MKITIDIDLSRERKKWANTALQNDVAANESQAATLEEYLAPKLQPFVEAKLNEITDSWKPIETEEIKERRAAVAVLLNEIPAEKLAAVEAAIAAEVQTKP
jgi:hypothetical protein